MIRRHPHVFGEAAASTADEVLENWDVIKRDERGQASVSEEMRGISKYLPALTRADKVIRKAKKRGYDFAKRETDQSLPARLFEAARLAGEDGIDLEWEMGRYIAGFVDEFEAWERG